MHTVKIGNFEVGAGNPLVLLAGPCVLESYERSLYIGKTIKEITSRLGIPYVFKASFDKANRSSYNGYRGPGLEKGLKWLQSIKDELNVPVVTDIHNETQVEPVSKVVDVLQIPAFLSRQTDLLYTAAKSGCVVNVKKGQFLAPADMKNVVKKLEEAGSEKILLTERGASFGYNNLVVDMRSFPIMRSTGYPVIFDATHSVQLPGGAGTSSAGNREYVEFLARGAEFEDGSVVEGESHLSKTEKKIKKVFYKENVSAYGETIKALEEADYIIFSIGSLYTSIIPNLLIDEVRDILSKSKAKKIYVCNAMEQPGVTVDYKVSDHINSINNHCKHNIIDYVIVNDDEIPKDVLDKYRLDGVKPVEIDEININNLNIELAKHRIIEINKTREVRHNSIRLASVIYSKILDWEYKSYELPIE